MGEPWQTHFDREQISQDLHRLGFAEIAVLSPDDADRLYFQGRDDALRAPRRASIAAAVVGPNA
jgi:hypothetical protein